jgi:hypothetical protein
MPTEGTMGKSYTPTYVVRYRDQQGPKILVWNTKTSGKPTASNLGKWREAMNSSMRAGGVNEHLSEALGFVLHIGNCEIHNQKTGETVATFVAPMFEEV